MCPQNSSVAKVNGVFESIFMIVHEKLLPHKEAHRIQFPLGKLRIKKGREREKTQVRRRLLLLLFWYHWQVKNNYKLRLSFGERIIFIFIIHLFYYFYWSLISLNSGVYRF